MIMFTATAFVLTVLTSIAFGNDAPLTIGFPDEAVRPHEEPPEEKVSAAASSASPDEDPNSLAEALRVLRKVKREVSGSYRPYTSFSSLGTHRYRYPLYRKRSTFPPLDYEDDHYLTPMDAAYDDYQDYMGRPSLFRERERGPVRPLISNAHFSSSPIKKGRPLYYSLENSPYDLELMEKLYNAGKRTRPIPIKSRDLDLPERFFGALNEINSQTPPESSYGSDFKNRAYSEMLHHIDNGDILKEEALSRPKREAPVYVNALPLLGNFSGNHTKGKHPGISNKLSLKQSDKRQKRAYGRSPIFYDPKEDANDFLTREYFKTIARSVGNKRKRLAFARFQAQKRSSAVSSFLETPQMLRYLQDQIKETEKEAAKEAQSEIEESTGSDEDVDGDSEVLLTKSIPRLSALERMREALYQLERIQEQDVIQKKAENLALPSPDQENWLDGDKEKRRKALQERLTKEGQKEREEERQKKAEEALRTIFKRNRRDECPVLERIVMNCIAVTEMVEDEAMIFLEPCLRHEVCYMCGSGLDVSRHECDAILSSALEAGCNEVYVIPNPTNGSLECLSAAGDTFSLLEDPSRYDGKGTCTFDPCVRQLLDSH